MRALILPTVLAAVLVALLGAASASADPGVAGPNAPSYSPPFVDHTEWAQWGQLPSLRVYPTASGRAAARQLGSAGTDADEAWAEVLALTPDAGTAGMREQFICHWQLAELAEPGKVSWNLEPWRPVVDATTMVGSGCNPGGSEERF
ncbi:MAG: DUF2599 domain-containing protein [Mycobacterium sp.]